MKDLQRGSLVRVNTTAEGRTVACGTDVLTSMSPSWSPDGRRVLFQSNGVNLSPEMMADGYDKLITLCQMIGTPDTNGWHFVKDVR